MVFAHVPPPDHGQSRMIAEMLRALKGQVRVIHVDARFSGGTGDIGSASPAKALRMLRYIAEALAGRWRHKARILYYVPGPVKWSAVVRDWVVLGFLRPAFPLLVLHWHAIGQGEWSMGSIRVRLPGPDWADRLARSVSRRMINGPDLSIAVAPKSTRDAIALGSWRTEVVCNGIADPCPNFADKIFPLRARRADDLASSNLPLRVLFLSRGSFEKGVIDALEALGLAAKAGTRIQATFAGGMDSDVVRPFRERMAELSGSGLDIELAGFLDEAGKVRCFANHDLLLSTSRWESFGLTVVEAMAWGMPVVAATSDGILGILPEDYPYFAQVEDILGISEAIQRCCRDLQSGKGVELATGSRTFYLENYTLEHYDRAICNVLAGTIRNSI